MKTMWLLILIAIVIASLLAGCAHYRSRIGEFRAISDVEAGYNQDKFDECMDAAEDNEDCNDN